MYLNGEYYNSLSEVTKSALDYHLWKTAGVEYGKETETIEFYNAERGTLTGKECTSGDGCNDTVKRTTEWQGYIALSYLTDWGYASTTEECNVNMKQKDGDLYICTKDNWMHSNDSSIWFLSAINRSGIATDVWNTSSIKNPYDSDTIYLYSVFPSVYLKSNVQIIVGNGTVDSPYILDIE